MHNPRIERRSSYKMDMCHGPMLAKIILYALPVMFTGILQLLFNAADMVVVGQFCGSNSVGAVGATGALIGLMVNLFTGLSVGAGVNVAVNVGANDDGAAHETVHTAIPTAFISGLMLSAIGICFSRQFLKWMGTPENVIGLSALYMRIYFCGMTQSMLYNYGAAILRAVGDTRRPLIFLTVAGVLNVLLNLLFVTVFRMDVAGVALATAISQTLAAVLVLAALARRDDCCRLVFGKMKIRRKPLLRIIAVGLPAGIQGSLFGISNVIIQSSVNSFGSVVLAGSSAAGNVESFVFISMNAFHHAGMNFVGQNYGARLYKRIGRIRLICLGCVTAVGIVMGWTIFFFARPLLSIYLADSPEAIEYGVVRMTYICLPYCLNGLHDVMTGIIRGMGRSTGPMLISIFGICVTRIAWVSTIFRLPAFHNMRFLFMTYPISWLITFLMLTVCYELIMRRMKRQGDGAAGTAEA